MLHLTSSGAVGQDAAEAHVLATAEDLDALRLVGQVLDVGALGKEAAVKHEERVGGLVHASRCGAERVARAPECCKLSTLWSASVTVPCERWCSCNFIAASERSGSGVGATAERCEGGA